MPEDRTPHGGEVMHPPPDRTKIPQPKPSGTDDPGTPEPPNAGRNSSTPASPDDNARPSVGRTGDR